MLSRSRRVGIRQQTARYSLASLRGRQQTQRRLQRAALRITQEKLVGPSPMSTTLTFPGQTARPRTSFARRGGRSALRAPERAARNRRISGPCKPAERGGGLRMLGHRRGERRLVVGEAKPMVNASISEGSRSRAMLASTQDESSPPESVSPTGTSARSYDRLPNDRTPTERHP